MNDVPRSRRAEAWASTMHGAPAPVPGVAARWAHADSSAKVGEVAAWDRAAREEAEADHAAPGATVARGAWQFAGTGDSGAPACPLCARVESKSEQ